MGTKRVLYTVTGLVVIIVVVILTALLVPQETNQAFATAIAFVNAAGKGDDATALTQLSDEVLSYVEANCPDASVSACLDTYIPPEWGEFLNAVFRRAQPDGQNVWDILLLATYAEGQGFSGICIYNRTELIEDQWKITRWSGFVSCDLPNAGLQALATDEDAPNKVP